MTATLDLDATDFFCGIGGSSTGLENAGWTIKLAANHSKRAIATHSANHPDTEHICADISNTDLRYLPKTRALWASPICTEISPAGGTRTKGSQLDMFEDYGHVPSEAFERTRATFWDVIRATEVHRYDAIMVENVVEAARWELFDIWLAGMDALGYEHQFLSVSAAHVGGENNPHAPQWRDRLYIVFTRHGIPKPDLQLRPIAYCFECDELVNAVQYWKKPGRPIGKYGKQYLYLCPNSRCKNAIVEPYVAPASVAIDWTDLGERIGDRDKPLSPATMRRIKVGLETIGDPGIVAAAGNTYEAGNYVRAYPALDAPLNVRSTTATDALVTSEPFVFATNHDSARHFNPGQQPLPTRSVRNGEALVMPEPFITMLRRNARPRATTDGPLATFSTARHHGLTIPAGAFISKHHGGLDYKNIHHMNKPITEPLPGIVGKVNNSLVIPYRRGSKAHRPDRTALSTMATKQAHGLLERALRVEDCRFRMLKAREAANAQRFPRDYILTGNLGEQQLGAGNAVACNVAQWIGTRVAAALA